MTDTRKEPLTEQLDSRPAVRDHHRVNVEAAMAAMRKGIGERSWVGPASFDDDCYPDPDLAAMIEDIVDAYHSVEPCPHCDGTGRRS